MQDTTLPPLTADEVARFLQQHPAFFEQHADVFSELTIPHPHEGRAISLGERQVLTLRERMHALQRQLTALTHHAKDSQRIVLGIQEWCLDLLAESDAAALPGHVTAGLARVFKVPHTALRLWGCRSDVDMPLPPASEEVEMFAASLTKPYCGTDTGFEAARWLDGTPASLAMVPIRTPRGHTFGLLILGSDDEERFSADMGTEFLGHIGALAGAALSRLLDPS